METNQEERDQYHETIKDIPKQSLVYIDESGIELTICEDRECSKKGEKLLCKRSGKHYEKNNIIARLVNYKSIAPMRFNGACNTNLFETWLKKFLIKALTSGHFVVIDNPSFHKSQQTKELIEYVKCKLIFLHPYLPDSNPIEILANMKRWIKDGIMAFNKLHDAIVQFFFVHNAA